MSKYNVVDERNKSLFKECASLEEAIKFAVPIFKSNNKKIKIKKLDDKDKVVKEFSFNQEEGRDIIMSYIDAGGLVISTPI